MAQSLGLSVTVFLLTALLTWGWIKIAQANSILDQPERRRLHLKRIPRAGGVSIALVLIAASIFVLHESHGDGYWPLIAISIVLYAVLGFLDDLKPLGSSMKLFLHLLVAIVIFFTALLPMSMSFMVSMLVAIIYMVFVNIWNFMDGSNGLVSMQSLIIVIGFIGLGDFPDNTLYFALTLAACCLGFLPFNFPVARVFLGDVGSHVLGAAVVGLAILVYFEGRWTLLEILCLTSALWVDATMTLLRRYHRGYTITQAHRSHLYQYAIRRGKSHAAVCWYYVFWTLAVIATIAYGRHLQEIGQQILLLTVLAVSCVLHQYLRLFVLKSHRSPKL